MRSWIFVFFREKFPELLVRDVKQKMAVSDMSERLEVLAKPAELIFVINAGEAVGADQEIPRFRGLGLQRDAEKGPLRRVFVEEIRIVFPLQIGIRKVPAGVLPRADQFVEVGHVMRMVKQHGKERPSQEKGDDEPLPFRRISREGFSRVDHEKRDHGQDVTDPQLGMHTDAEENENNGERDPKGKGILPSIGRRF